jgi:ketosteroid isomerase-like protein
MRTALTFAVLVGLLACACSSESVARPPPPPVNWRSLEAQPAALDAGKIAATDKERAAADAYLKALASPGFVDLGRLLDDDAHFAFAGFRDVHGRDNVVKVYDALLGTLDARSFAASRVFLTDSAQIIEWTMSGIHKAASKPVTIKGVTLLWTKDDGTISDTHLYFDEALLKAQVGVGPKTLMSIRPPSMPSGAPQTVEQARSPAESANVTVVRASLETLENKDESAYLATLADDVEVTTLEGAKPLRGKTEARAYLNAMHKAIAQLDTGIDNVWAIGPFVVVEYHVVGEQRGPIGWVPAQKDNLLKMFVVDVAELHDGKIARVWRYDNPSQILLMP